MSSREIVSNKKELVREFYGVFNILLAINLIKNGLKGLGYYNLRNVMYQLTRHYSISNRLPKWARKFIAYEYLSEQPFKAIEPGKPGRPEDENSQLVAIMGSHLAGIEIANKKSKRQAQKTAGEVFYKSRASIQDSMKRQYPKYKDAWEKASHETSQLFPEVVDQYPESLPKLPEWE